MKVSIQGNVGDLSISIARRRAKLCKQRIQVFLLFQSLSFFLSCSEKDAADPLDSSSSGATVPGACCAMSLTGQCELVLAKIAS